MLTVKFICDNCGDVYKVIEGGIVKRYIQDKVRYVDDKGEEHEVAGPDSPCHNCEAAANQAREKALAGRKKTNGNT